jgi:hypothetical protein
MGLANQVAIIGTGNYSLRRERSTSPTRTWVYEGGVLRHGGCRRRGSGDQGGGWLRDLRAAPLRIPSGQRAPFVGDKTEPPPPARSRSPAWRPYCAVGDGGRAGNAALAVASGEYDVVLVVGAEKQREVPFAREPPSPQAMERATPCSHGPHGPRLFARLASRDTSRSTGASTRSALGAVAVTNHWHGKPSNPNAQLPRAFTRSSTRRRAVGP